MTDFERAVAGEQESPLFPAMDALDQCQHADWRLDFTGIFDPGIPVDGPYGARKMTPLCSECGEPVQVGAPE